jgi:hypothetical protein
MRITKNGYKFPRHFNEYKKGNLKYDLVFQTW